MSELERFKRGQGVHQPGFAAQLNDIIDAIEQVQDDVVSLESGKATTTHTHDGLNTGVWGNITGTLSDQTDLNSALSGKSDTSHNHSGTYAPTSHAHSGSDVTSGTVDAARLPVGTGTTQVAAGDHTHTGVYAGASHAHAGSDITSGTVDTARLSTGTGSTNVALGDHNHSGTYATAAHSHSKITPSLAIGDDGEPTKGQLTIADNAGNVTVLTCLDGTTSLGVNGVAASLSGHTHSYAATSHNHAGSDITSGVVGKTYGGAGDVTGILKANGSGTVSAAGSTDYIAPTLVDAKGDIIVASGADAVARLAVGADGLVVSADSAATNGVSYKLPNRMDMEVQEMSARIATGSSPLLAWTFPLVSYGYGSFSATDGQLVAVKCWIPETITATGMVIMQGDTTLTNPDNYNGLALFSSVGTLIAKTADQGTAWGSGTNQFKAAAFDDGTHQITGGPGVYVYLAVLTNSNGGTQPKFLTIVNPSSAQINAGYTAGSTSATVFHGNKSGQTAMPSAANGLFTLTVGGYPWWMALY